MPYQLADTFLKYLEERCILGSLCSPGAPYTIGIEIFDIPSRVVEEVLLPESRRQFECSGKKDRYTITYKRAFTASGREVLRVLYGFASVCTQRKGGPHVS